MLKLQVSLAVLSSLLIATSAVDCDAAASSSAATCAVTSAVAGVLGIIVCGATAGIGCGALAAGGAVTALCSAVAGNVDCGGDGDEDSQLKIIGYLDAIQEDVNVLGSKVDFGFYENKYDSYINKIISSTGRYQQDIVKKTIGDKTARYANNIMIREYVDDILGDGAYDVRGALTIIDGMITGRQGITQSPSVYELAMDNKVCTVELFDFMTNLIIEGTNTAFVAMELRPQGGGVHQADKDQLTKRLEDNLNEFKSACSHYQPTNGEHSKMTIDVLKEPYEEYWGPWGKMETCSDGGYATGFKLKVQGAQGSWYDDTALNSICLVCSRGDEICSTQGWYGGWGTAKNEDKEPKETCEEGFSASKLRVEKWVNRADNTGANNLYLYCNDKESTEFATTNGGPWGDWYESTCHNGNVICGLSTKIRNYAGWADDTSLSGVEFQCCEDIW